MNFLLRKDEAEKTYMKKEESYTKAEVDEILGNELDKYIVIQNIAPVEEDGKQKIILYVAQASFANPKDSMKVGLLYQTNLTDTVGSVLINDKTTISDADSVNIKHGVVNINNSLNVPLAIDVSTSENHLMACKLYVQFNNGEGNTKTIYGPAYIYSYGILLSQANRTIASTESYKNLNDKVITIETELFNKVDKVEGKNLSTNDFTDELKIKLEGIEEGANKIIIDSALSTTSTNVIQTKAVGLKFQDVDLEISGINSVLNSTADEIATIVNAYGSKNLVDTSLIPNSIGDGVTGKNNGDGSITYSGTSTLTYAQYLPLMAEQNLGKGTYIFTLNPTTTATDEYVLQKNGVIWKKYVANQTIEITEAGKYSIGLVLKSKATIRNTFKPMLRYAAIKDDTFVPYAMTNRELTTTLKNKPNSADVYTKTEVDNKYFMSGDLGIELSEDTDLNSIITPGNYYTKTYNIAKSCLNIPYNIIGCFRLEVSYLWNNNAFYYLVQKLYITDKNNFDIFIRMKGNLEEWSPWHLINRNDFTTCSFSDNNINDKYMKIASNKVNAVSDQGNTMVFDVYPNYSKQSGNVNSNEIGKLLCSGYGSYSDYNISAIWVSKGLDIYPEDWFVTYHQDGHDFLLELWKKARNAYESYNVVLSCSSEGPLIAGASVNAVTMYYLKDTADTYDASLYEKVVTSTTCDTTSVTQLEFGNAIATNLINTSKISSTTAYGVERTVYPDGKISYDGTSTLTTDYFLVLMASRPLTAGNYRFTPNGTAISGVVPTTYQLYKDNKYLKGINPSKVITIDTNGTYGIGAIIKPKATINTEFYPMLESGSDAHNYVQYTGDTGTLNGDLATLALKFNDPDWTLVSIGSDVTSGSLEYKQFNALTNVVGKNIQVLNAVKTVSIGSLSVNQRPHVTIRIPTDTINVFVIITTDGTISLQHTTGTLSTSASYTFSATYLK